LYKFEVAIAHAIEDTFAGEFELADEFVLPITTEADCSAARWRERAAKRKEAIDKYLWNEERGIYLDYNTKSKKQEMADSATCLWALWCGVASPHQASRLVEGALPLFECAGGLASCSERTGHMFKRRPYQSQWDYPHGWAHVARAASRKWEINTNGLRGEARFFLDTV
jgi:alpha,alpha-trehalase